MANVVVDKKINQTKTNICFFIFSPMTTPSQFNKETPLSYHGLLFFHDLPFITF